VNPEIKAEWVAALRSGDYIQGKGQLCAEDHEGKMRHCCLGVLSELAVKAGVAERTRLMRDLPIVDFDGVTGFLPKSVQEWAELDSESPSVAGPFKGVLTSAGAVSLAGLNDAGVPFEKIAELIEAHL
jgi:hypothetical protein